MFPLIAPYGELFLVDTKLKELLHLIYCKSIYEKLVIDEIPYAWFDCDYEDLNTALWLPYLHFWLLALSFFIGIT
jgi:hypothetical protein